MSVEREHFFSIAVARHVFSHKKRGIVFAADPLPLKEAERYGLTPLIIYGISLPGVPGSHIRLAHQSNPLPIVDVLRDIWTSTPALRGKPNKLRVSRACAEADDGFIQTLISDGLAVTVAGSNDKSHAGALRNCQKEARELAFWGRKNLPMSLDDLNRLRVRTVDATLYLRKPEQRQVFEHWQAFHFQEASHLHAKGLDFRPGAWMSSWESSSVHGISRTFSTEPEMPNWLVSGAFSDDEMDEALDDYALRALKNVVHCWPGGVKAVASAIGATMKELQQLMAGTAPLDPEKMEQLIALIGMEVHHVSGTYEAEGPCVLIAETPLHAKEAYDELSNGGDLIFSIDAVSDKGMPDPSWHYLLYMSYDYGLNVLMIPRGSKLTAAMPRNFLNFNGTQKIPERIYRDIVATCSKVCLNPVQNIEFMVELSERHQDFFESLEDAYPIIRN